MSVLVWDSTASAWKEAETPMVYDAIGGGWNDSVSKVWDSTEGAWKDAWGGELDPWQFYIQPSYNPITFPYTLVRSGTQYYVYMPVVDFSAYKGKVVKMSFTNHTGGGRVVLKAEADTTVSQDSSNSSDTLSLNLTGLTGSGSIKTAVDYSTSASFTITNIWLE